MTNDRAEVTFYFDPLCPWAWMTSLWMREVQQHRPIDVEWKFFSLAGVNERDDKWHNPLRICAQARQEGGNEAVGRAYLAMGRLFHERKDSFDEIDNLAQDARPYLEEVGLDPDLGTRALENPQTIQDVLKEHTEAVERYGAFGVPWILTAGDDAGFFGPVIGELITGDDAVALWDDFQAVSRRPYLYELKRGNRKKMQDLAGLSQRFGQTVPAAR